MINKKTKIIIIICVIAAVVLAIGGLLLHMRQAGAESRAVLADMEEIVPGLGEESVYSSGMGRDPLVALEIRGIDIVGCIEIPSQNLRAPVTDKGNRQDYFATWVSGSPVKGRFRLIGNKTDVFRKLPKAAPGDTVLFTDIDGVRYEYSVTTQFHQKDWAKADYDLMLCYKTDSDTKFVLGCTKTE